MSETELPERSWIPAFLAALSQSPNVAAAARAAGIDRSVPYKLFHADDNFKAAFIEAQETATDALEGRAYEMAMSGESPALAMFLLKGRRREIYGDQVKAQVDSNINLNGSITLYMPQNGREAEGENGEA